MRSTIRNRRAARSLLWVALLAAGCLVLVNCAGLGVERNGWSKKWGPMVPHETFPGDCAVCHVAENWKTLKADFEFDHRAETGFALNGAHSDAVCLRCHNDRGPVAVYVERGCAGCHGDPHFGRLGLNCTECHNERHWEPTGLIADHARTRFPLVAAHALTDCETCHVRAEAGDFSGTPVECHLCHQKEAAGAFPNHVVNGWIVGCENCHNPADWNAVDINHDFFPLVGGHANVDCTQCHPGGLFVAVNPDCFACHSNDYVNAPNHVTNGFSTNCLDCHTINAWDDTP